MERLPVKPKERVSAELGRMPALQKGELMTEAAPRTEVWDQLLDREWQEKRRTVDWKGLAYVHHHIALLVGNGPAHVPLHWYDHLRDAHLRPYVEAATGDARRGVSLLSLGCGDGSMERRLFDFNWPIRSIHCCEMSPALLEAGRKRFSDLPSQVGTHFTQFDMNQTRGRDLGRYDVVFFCHALHHCDEIEDMVEFLQRSLVPGGLVLGIDYFGPARLQTSLRTNALLTELFDLLPERLRVDLGGERPQPSQSFRPPGFRSVMQSDPSEAPRSADIKNLLFGAFEVCDVRPMGGTLLRHVLWNRAGNYRAEGDQELLRLLCFIERELIRSHALESDELLFVLRAPTG